MNPGTLFVRLPLVLAAVACAAVPAAAQQTVTMAGVYGRVFDPDGAAIAGAQVTASSQERGQSWRATTDTAGRYRLAFLPVDTYELRVELAPYRTRVRTLRLAVGQTVEVPVQLTVALPDQTVDVSGDAPVVEATRTQVAETVVSREIAGLPLNGRSYLDLAALTPGVSAARSR